jgi:pyruvate dehydrogenase E2 component (dihydrolipoamide acetyltransferase)
VLELETDKAVIELPCPLAGRIEKIHVSVGDRVPVGTTILTIEQDATETAAKKRKEPPKQQPAIAKEGPKTEPPPKKEAKAEKPAAASAESPKRRDQEPEVIERAARKPPGPVAPASPAVRHLARELGVDLSQVEGTGPGDRITPDDVKRYVRELATGATGLTMTTAATLPDFTKWGTVERRPLRGVRRKTAENLSVAWATVPHVTQFDNADVTELEAARKKYVSNKRAIAQKQQAAGETPITVPPLTMTVLVTKAIVKALKRYPQFNSSLDAASGELILKQYYHIGIAVDTEHGLIVPVVRDVDQKGILELANEVDELARRARDRKLDIEEMRGGTFTISNLGGLGGTAFSPIVNFPEVAVLGIARSRHEQVIIDGRPETRIILPLCLSYDHRVIDGADGVRFVRMLADILADPFDLLLEA